MMGMKEDERKEEKLDDWGWADWNCIAQKKGG